MIAQPLAEWGALIEVVEPEAVQVQLRRLAREVLDLYPA
jgi:hypothetical protein